VAFSVDKPVNSREIIGLRAVQACDGVCIGAMTNLDKIFARTEIGVFAQSVPVDIKKLIHR
jgi:hypothetical protein